MPARPLIPLDIIKEPFNNSFTMDGILSGSWIVGKEEIFAWHFILFFCFSQPPGTRNQTHAPG